MAVLNFLYPVNDANAEISGTDTGSFHETFAALYAFSTGEDPFGEGVGLIRYTRDAAKFYKERAAILTKADEWDEEMMHRSMELHEELKAL